MAKKSNKAESAVVEPTSKCFCQYCKNHKNNPSKCKLTDKYVGRKTAGCDKFKEVQ